MEISPVILFGIIWVVLLIGFAIGNQEVKLNKNVIVLENDIVGKYNNKNGFYCIKIENRTKEEIYNQFDNTINELELYSTKIRGR